MKLSEEKKRQLQSLIFAGMIHVLILTSVGLSFSKIKESLAPDFYFLGSILSSDFKRSFAEKNNWPIAVPGLNIQSAKEENTHSLLSKPQGSLRSSLKEKEIVKTTFLEEKKESALTDASDLKSLGINLDDGPAFQPLRMTP